MKLNWPAIGVIVSVTILVLLVGGWFYSYGNLQARVDELAKDQTEMRQEMRDGFDRLEAKIDTSKEEVIAAISEHEHDEDGKVIFKRPY